MDEKKSIESKLTENYSEHKKIMSEQNPYKDGTKEWIQWQMKQSEKRRANFAISVELMKKALKDEPSSVNMDNLDWNKVLAPSSERIEKYKQQILDFKHQQSSEMKMRTQNDNTTI